MNKNDKNQAKNRLLRQKAEEKLKKQRNRARPDMKSDSKKLLHELQVHQIELEMQHENLQKANEANEAALKKYTMLYDFAPMGYFTLSSDGTICELNFTGADLLGESRFTLVNRNFMQYVSKGSQKTFTDFFSKIYTGRGKKTCEIMLGYNNNPLCQVYMKGVLTSYNNQVLLSVVDITGLRKTNQYG